MFPPKSVLAKMGLPCALDRRQALLTCYVHRLATTELSTLSPRDKEKVRRLHTQRPSFCPPMALHLTLLKCPNAENQAHE